MKIIDLIGIALIVIGITLTVFTYKAIRIPGSDMQSVTIHEIVPHPPGDRI